MIGFLAKLGGWQSLGLIGAVALIGSGSAYLKGRSDGAAVTIAQVESDRNQQLIGAMSATHQAWATVQKDLIKANLRNWQLAIENSKQKTKVVTRWRYRTSKVESNDDPILQQTVPADIMLHINCLRDPRHNAACGDRLAQVESGGVGEPVSGEIDILAGDTDG